MRPMRLHWFTVAGFLLMVVSLARINPSAGGVFVGVVLIMLGLWIVGGEAE